MKLQTTLYGCGAAAMANALRAAGFVIGDDAVASAAGTDGDGTNAAQLKAAAARLGAKVRVVNERVASRAFERLVFALERDSAPCVLLVDKGEHWVTAIGMLGDEVNVIDPAASVRDMVTLMDSQELERVWRCSGRYYGIVVTKED